MPPTGPQDSLCLGMPSLSSGRAPSWSLKLFGRRGPYLTFHGS